MKVKVDSGHTLAWNMKKDAANQVIESTIIQEQVKLAAWTKENIIKDILSAEDYEKIESNPSLMLLVGNDGSLNITWDEEKDAGNDG